MKEISTNNNISKEKDMSFLGHLEEMRWRLVKCSILVVSTGVVLFIFIDQIFKNVIMPPKDISFITYKVFNKLGRIVGLDHDLFTNEIPFNLQNIEMMGQFTTHMTVAFLGGLVISFPFIFLQIWRFVKPGLNSTELNGSKNVLLYSTVLMLFGLLFGYYIVTPLSVQFFGAYSVSDSIENQIRLGSYISMVVKTTFLSGLLFQLPVFIYILVKIGVISSDLLKKFRKHAIVGILVLSAIITPPDLITQIIVGIPVYILYEVGILVSKRVEKNRVE